MISLKLVVMLSCFLLSSSSGQLVDTKYGEIRGSMINVLNTEVDVFHGVPFAKAPVGDLRFKHPVTPDPWRPEVKDAIDEKPSCIQPQHAFDFLDDYRHYPDDVSEDCLHLNIWRASHVQAGANLTVMFYIYGGGWSTGSTRLTLYSGKYLAASNDVIVVTANYRLGPLGFGYMSPGSIPGNMGLMDQILALQWVKDNIYNFGGNPDAVTIFGQSAGAVAVGLHLLSPLSRDLFKYAILESGSPVQTFDRHSVYDKRQAQNSFTAFARHAGCEFISSYDLLSCLQALNASDISPAFMKGVAEGYAHVPVIDDYFLYDFPRELMRRGDFKKTNIMQGFTQKEATVLMYPLLLNLTRDGVTEARYREILSQYIRLPGPENTRRVEAMRQFYDDLQDPLVPTNYINVMNEMRNDMDYTCRAINFSSSFSNTNGLYTYMYSFNHRLSTSKYPYWIGATHSYELEFVFGFVLNKSRGFTDDEVALAQNMMTYWTNFAKSGDPNTPVKQKMTWSPFTADMKPYMVLDIGDNLGSYHRLRHAQCNFINNIIPLIPAGDTEQCQHGTDPKIYWPHVSTGVKTGVVNLMLLVIGVIIGIVTS